MSVLSDTKRSISGLSIGVFAGAYYWIRLVRGRPPGSDQGYVYALLPRDAERQQPRPFGLMPSITSAAIMKTFERAIHSDAPDVIDPSAVSLLSYSILRTSSNDISIRV